MRLPVTSLEIDMFYGEYQVCRRHMQRFDFAIKIKFLMLGKKYKGMLTKVPR